MRAVAVGNGCVQEDMFDYKRKPPRHHAAPVRSRTLVVSAAGSLTQLFSHAVAAGPTGNAFTLSRLAPDGLTSRNPPCPFLHGKNPFETGSSEQTAAASRARVGLLKAYLR